MYTICRDVCEGHILYVGRYMICCNRSICPHIINIPVPSRERERKRQINACVYLLHTHANAKLHAFAIDCCVSVLNLHITAPIGENVSNPSQNLTLDALASPSGIPSLRPSWPRRFMQDAGVIGVDGENAVLCVFVHICMYICKYVQMYR